MVIELALSCCHNAFDRDCAKLGTVGNEVRQKDKPAVKLNDWFKQCQ